jgi:nicotinate dehydrogenase subunit B
MKKTITNVNEALKSPDHSGMKRRDFFKLLGGGIFIFFQPWITLDLSDAPEEQARSLSKDYNAFLQIGEDGVVTCFTGKIEMGQGAITSLAMMMADELNVQFEKVKMVMGDTDLCPYDAGTWGSQTIQNFGPNMRAAAAEARVILFELASVKLGVPASQLEVKDGIITDIKNSRNVVTYAQLAKGKKLEKHLDIKPSVEDYSKLT